jgi:transposase InsO family protein
MSHATHANAALTPRARLRLARLVVDHGWTPARAAERYDVSWRTAAKWAARYRTEGPGGMVDRSSRPHHQPNRTPAPVVRKIVHLRWKQRLGPVEIGDRLAMPSSTVHAVLVRCRLNRLSHLDRATGEPVRRYEHERPGDLLHVDVKKLGNVPDGGGWRFLGRVQGHRNAAATARRTGSRTSTYHPSIGTAFVHTVLDDYSRVAYAEIHEDEKKETAALVLRNGVAWFAERGVTVQRVLSDNGSCYRSMLWAETCAELAITHKRTRPYRPQTNGKIERFHRTLAEGWAFKKFYNSESARRAALPAWIHHYNHHRPHTAIGKATPITRLNNLAGHHS